MFFTIIIFIIVLGLLVFVHEAGHFIAAKKSGMRVLEFGFGFPPRLIGLQKIDGRWKVVWGYSKKFVPEPVEGQISSFATLTHSTSSGIKVAMPASDETVYSINAIPLGGFVKIWGENNEHENDPRSFINRPFWARCITLIAGVLMNVVLAWILISIGFTIGMPTAVDNPSTLPASAVLKNRQPTIVEIIPGGPAQKAGLLSGDAILQIDGQNFGSLAGIKDYIRSQTGKVFAFKVKRAGQELSFSVASTAKPAEGEGPTGIAIADVGLLSFPWHRAIGEGARATFLQLGNIARGLYHLLTSRLGLAALGGPVKIARLTGEVASMGLIYLLQFTAFLSLNLAILNILPFPALDGGRLLFLIIEKLRGKRNNPKIEQAVNAAGFAVLILLMVLVTIKDVRGLGN